LQEFPVSNNLIGRQKMKNKSIYSYCSIFLVILLIILAFTTKTVAEQRIFHKAVKKPVQWYKPDELIIKFRADTPEKTVEKINLRHGVSHISKNRRIGFRKLRVEKGKNIFDLAAAYAKDPNVEYARPNYICRAYFVPNDQFYPYQWNFQLINMERAWDIETADPGVVVAVVDTGVAYENYTERIFRRWRKHYYQAPDLAQTSFVPGYDFINDDEHPNDDEGHGTHITGTIAQSTHNQIGVAGIAFNCSIMPVKVMDSSGSGTVDSLANGIIFAADNGAKVINMSLGFSSDITPADIPAVTEAVQYAYNKGCVLVASSGNEGINIVSLPAAYPEVIAVGAVHSGDARADYSQYGSDLELVAPGGDTENRNGDGYMDGVLQETFGSDTDDWGYWFYTGTSCAAPHVCGVAALLLSNSVATTPDEVREALRSTAVDKGPAGWDQEYGWGRVDAYAALQWTAGPVDNPPTVSITSPTDGVTVSGTITITAAASDDAGIDRVDFYYDSTLIGTDTTSAYSVNWDTTAVGDSAYTITAAAVDTASQTVTDSISVIVENTNDPPVADAGPDQEALAGQAVSFDGSGSSDPDGTIVSYSWDFNASDGISEDAAGVTASHTYSSSGTYTVTLTVTDNAGATNQDTAIVTVSEEPAEVEVFFDSFESGLGNWTQDSQNDWFRSTQRAIDGSWSAEVDGRASDATLTSEDIDLQGKKNAVITFSWFIERGLDRGEYLAFDVSTDGGSNWTQKAELKGNEDPENTWHNVSVDLSNISSLKIRFRAKISRFNEDANVDMVKVVAL